MPVIDDEIDYGEGKTREQEAEDTIRMLATVLLVSWFTIAVVVVLLVWRY